MLPHLPPAVYKCIIPVQQSLIAPSVSYHSPNGRLGEVPQTPFFTAWPAIENPVEPCCLPTLHALYFYKLDILEEPENFITRAKTYLSRPEVVAPEIVQEEYLSRPEVFSPEIVQQVLGILQSHLNLARDATWSNNLSPRGKPGKKPQRSLDPHGSFIDFLNMFVGDNANKLIDAAMYVHIPRMSATQSMGTLPLNPREAFHPVHVNAATWTTGRLPPPPGEACHHRSRATPGRYC